MISAAAASQRSRRCARAKSRALSMATPAAAASATTISSSSSAELGGALLLGQVEVAEDLVADADRHAEEAVHRRVVRREAVRPRVLGDVRHPHRAGVGDEQAEHAAAARQVADGGVHLGVDAVGDEVGQLPVRPDDAEGAVAGADQLAGRLDDALQRAAQVEVACRCRPRRRAGPAAAPGWPPPRRRGRASPAAARRGGPGTAGSARGRRPRVTLHRSACDRHGTRWPVRLAGPSRAGRRDLRPLVPGQRRV